MTKSRGINAPRWQPTDDQVDLVRRLFPTTKTQEIADMLGVKYSHVSKLATKLGLKKDPAFLNGPAGGRLDGIKGAGTRFQPGVKPWNAGKKLPGHGDPDTYFKPGSRNGAAKANYVPLGSYRINAEGYLDRKVFEGRKGALNWEAVHRLVWKEQVGPIPPCHIVRFRQGMRTTVLEDITPDRLECITQAENARRNSIWKHSPEVARLLQLKGAITRQVNRITKEAQA